MDNSKVRIVKKLITAPDFIWIQNLIPLLTNMGVEVPKENFSTRFFIEKVINFDAMIKIFSVRQRAFLTKKLLESFGITAKENDKEISFSYNEDSSKEEAAVLFEVLTEITSKPVEAVVSNLNQ